MYFLLAFMAVILDRLVGDPQKWHPVISIGRLIQCCDHYLNRHRFLYIKGFLTVIVTVGLTTMIVFTIVQLAQLLSFWLWVVVEVCLISLALAQKSLQEAAMLVYDALQRGDFVEAREKLSWIVGRDTAHLDEPEIVRGVIETVSENTSDGVTAPLCYALLFGATGAWCYKAINTLDSMIAYQNDRYAQFGYAAAKLDDIANIIPSRLTGFLLLIGTVATQRQRFSFRVNNWLQDAKKHPSPNSGYLEAATAWQLGIRLGGYNRYGARESFRAYMGKPYVVMNRQHIVVAITHMQRCTMYLLILGGILYALSGTWS